jgi:universal stress protein A
MNKYRRILATVDFSDSNQAAIRRAVELAQQYQSELILLHVIEHFPYGDGPLASAIPDATEADQRLLTLARTKLQSLANQLGATQAKLAVLVTGKSARREIVRFAEANSVDLVVVAPHERGFVGALGSTAMGVVNHVACDVLAVRQGE